MTPAWSDQIYVSFTLAGPEQQKIWLLLKYPSVREQKKK